MMEGRAAEMLLRELLLHLLEYTSTDVIDELWPDNATTLDEIAGQILARDAHELAEKQRAFSGPSMTLAGNTMVPLDLITNLIDPEVSSDEQV